MYECLEEKYRQRLRWILTPCTGVCMYVFLCLWECVHMYVWVSEGASHSACETSVP